MLNKTQLIDEIKRRIGDHCTVITAAASADMKELAGKENARRDELQSLMAWINKQGRNE